MMKYIFFFSFIIFFLVNGCEQKKDTFSLKNSEKLDIVIKYTIPHLQSQTEMNLFQKYKINSVSIVKTVDSSGVIDSVTYLKIDKKGRIISRTTSECTTIGCLPYTTYQKFLYSKDTLKQMIDYTFKKRYKFVSTYWEINDTNKLSKFDWEDYTYKNDTLTVKSALQIWKFKKNPNGQIISDNLKIKNTTQSRTITYLYSDSNVVEKINTNFNTTTYISGYKILNDTTVLYTSNTNPKKIPKVKFEFNSKGLLREINSYLNNDELYKKKFYYSYY